MEITFLFHTEPNKGVGDNQFEPVEFTPKQRKVVWNRISVVVELFSGEFFPSFLSF
jgi:hypothetical protein